MCDVFADGIKENPAAPHHFSPEISDWPRIIVPTELLSFPSDKVNVPRRFLLFTDIPKKGKKTKIPHQLTVKFTARIEDCHLLETLSLQKSEVKFKKRIVVSQLSLFTTGTTFCEGLSFLLFDP